MPRTRPLTSAQKEADQINRICQNLLDRLNEKRGRERKTDAEFSQSIGISRATWYRWNRGELADCQFNKVMTAAIRAGFTVEMAQRGRPPITQDSA